MLPQGDSYEAVCQAFRWQIPETFNIAQAVCDRHAQDPDRIALIYEDAAGQVERISFSALQRRANRFANLACASGWQRGDRVAILLPVHPAVVMVHVGCWKAGLVSCPMSVLFGSDGLEYRLNNCGARAIVTDAARLETVLAVRERCPQLEQVFVIDGKNLPDGVEHLDAACENLSDAYETLATSPDDPAYINYTSGTTGNPKGALQPHRQLLGHVPPIEYIFDYPRDGDVLWTPADWSWLAGLMDVLMPGLFLGLPVAVKEPTGGFNAEAALEFMARHDVTLALLVPTMLKLMRQVPDLGRFDLSLRTVGSGGESVGAELLHWGRQELGVTVNEGYGQTECNVMLVNNMRLNKVKPGSFGLPAPGFEVAIVDEAGNELPPDSEGQIACKRPNPVMMLEYWKNPDATRDKYAGDWLLTGDLGHKDRDGYFWFHGRADDVITSSGYRIGPGEIEEALMKHPAVAMAAAVGIPDPARTERIKAFIVAAPGYQGSNALAEEIRADVKTRLAKHEAPHEIEFLDALPMGVTGKILRRELRQRG